jgi:GNAT superfamily N-acetyltransferase
MNSGVTRLRPFRERTECSGSIGRKRSRSLRPHSFMPVSLRPIPCLVDTRRLHSVFVRQTGQLAGALIAATVWTWLSIDVLWVDPSHRGQGFGQAMVREAEAITRERGCTRARMLTAYVRPGELRDGKRERGVDIAFTSCWSDRNPPSERSASERADVEQILPGRVREGYRAMGKRHHLA